MDATITQASLHYALRLAARAVPSRATLPILQHFLLEAGPNGLTVSATDTEMAVVTTVPAGVGTPGRATVTARLLDDFIGHLPDKPVRLTLAPNRPRLEVRSGSFSAGFATADVDDFPVLLSADGGAALTLDARRLRDALQRVTFAAARDEQRPVLATVLIRSTSDGLVFAAADGFRLARMNLPGAGLPACEALVPARAASEMGRLLADAERCDLLFAPSGRSMQLRVKDTLLFVRLVEGTFPDFDRIIPAATETRITVETAVLRRALGAVSLFGGSGSGRPVRVEAGDGRLRLLAKSAETGDAETDVPAEINGNPQVVTLSTPLVADVLAAATGRQLTVDLNGPAAPVVLREPEDDTGGLWLVMPLFTVDSARSSTAPPTATTSATSPARPHLVPAEDTPTEPDANQQEPALPRAA